MDTAWMHSLNSFLLRHDLIEDPVVAYEKIAQFLFVAILIGLFLVVRGRNQSLARRAAVAAAASAALALTLGNLLSSTIDRPRPFVAHPELVHLFVKHVADAGFPSDHATASFAIATAVFLRNRAWGAVILLLATVLAIGRVGMGVHYPSDVLAGAALGAVSALLLWALPIRARIDALADWFAGLADRTERRALAVIGSDS